MLRHTSFAILGFTALAAVPAAAQRLAPTIPVEVFAGKLEFNSDLDLPDQELAGLRLGVDLASYAGIRGYYWRGLNDDRDGWAPVQSYGAEAQLNLNAGNGLTPFLVGGVGKIDFMDGYADDGSQPEDRNALIAGAGLRLDVGRVGIVAAARDYLFQRDADSGDDLIGNIQYSAGLAFRLGGRGRREPVAATPRVIRQAPDTVYVSRDPAGRVREEETQNFVTIPVPKEGEIYLRYGPADSAGIVQRPSVQTGVAGSAELEVVRARLLADLQPMLRQMLESERAEIRDIIRQEMDRMPEAGLSAAAEQRLLDNLEARLALRMRDELGRPLVVDTAGRAVAVRPAVRGSRFQPGIREVRPYLGANVDDPTQFMLGVRLDMGPFDVARPQLRLVPDASIGMGHGTAAVMIAAHAQYDIPALNLGRRTVQPYVYAGPGVLFFGDPPRGRAKAEAVLNAGYGISTELPGDRGLFFIEHQGVDLFDLNRVLIGLRL